MSPANEAAALFGAYRDQVYRYLLVMVRNPAEADDLTQDTFLRACARCDALRDPNAVRGWLYRIATRTCVDHWRERRARAPVDARPDAPPLDSIAAASPSALENAERHETGACVQRCLDLLSNGYRAVLLLHEGHGLTAAEIAEMLNESVGAVKIRLHRARGKLEQIMNMGCSVSHDRNGVPGCEPKARAH